ncbi:hypothetical protein BJ944DRAFT_227652 [Cunninghamella echinulata]|nr:hypothetical protein BJ944DRAFT_227652 [Cunninghamella echinulata]
MEFFYEDGQGNIVNEKRDNPLESNDQEDSIQLDILLKLQQYSNIQLELPKVDMNGDVIAVDLQPLKNEEKKVAKSPIRNCNKYTEMDKYRLIMLILEKLLKAGQAGRQLGIQERTAQRWWKEYRENPDIFFNSKEKTKRKTKKLHDIHKEHIIKYTDDYLSTAVDQVMGSSIKKLEDLDIKKSAVHKFMNEEYHLTF